ncbi:MAG TPA: CBS domain-containing protein [Acetobacteraceae bacterium]|nr:CBS domain-containing protein [Acetobacteraceae bacterium]
MADNPDKKATDSQEQIRASARNASQGAAEATQRSAAAAEHAGRLSGETVRESGEATADAMRRGADANADAMRHFGEAAADSTRRGTNMLAEQHRRFVESTTEQLERAARTMAQAVQERAQDVRTMMVLPRLSGEGFGDMQQSLERLVQGVIQTNLRSAEQLFQLADTGRFVAAQQQFLRDYLGTLFEGTTILVRSVRQFADQALNNLEQQLEQRRREGQGAERPEASGQQRGRVADVMHRDVRIASPDDTAQQAARLMREEDTGALPVGENDRLVGMVTDRDLAVRVAAEGRDPARTKVREVMTPEVRYVFEDEDLKRVAETMAEQQVRRLPVMNRNKRLVGVVSLSDIAKRGQSEEAGHALRGVAREGGRHTQTAAE